MYVGTYVLKHIINTNKETGKEKVTGLVDAMYGSTEGSFSVSHFN